MLNSRVNLFFFLFLIKVFYTKSFLLDNTTPNSNNGNGLSDKHYIILTEALYEEKRARQNLEVSMTQLFHEFMALKNSSQNSNPGTVQSNNELQKKVIELERRTGTLEIKLSMVQNENIGLKNNVSALVSENSNLKTDNGNILTQFQNVSDRLLKAETEISTLAQLKSINNLQTVNNLVTDSDGLKRRVNSLESTQNARAEDFLALYNKTLAIESKHGVLESKLNGKIFELSKNQNVSIEEVKKTVELAANKSNATITTIMTEVNSKITGINKSIQDANKERGVTYTRWGRKQCPQQAETVYTGYTGGGHYHDQGAAPEPVCLPMDPNYNKTSGGTANMYGAIYNAIGVTYIRWGRKQCPSNAETVYTGYTGGGHYRNTGSAPEPVCLPMDPNYNKTSGGTANMYGAIYNGDFFAQGSHTHDVPCTVCRALNVSSVIMIPGKNACTSGWRREYHGYLAAGYSGHKAASSYVCIHIDAEHDAGGWRSNYKGKVFFSVYGQCGSLRCPPYKNNYPLTCVVCSK